MNLVVDSLDVSVKDEGEGPVVLLLHGWMSDLHAFDSLAEELSKKYRVIRPSLPGFGGSQIPPSTWGVPEYADFINSYLTKMKATELAAVVGHSMGGRIAIYALANGVIESPKMVLIGSAGIPESKSPRSLGFLVLAKIGKVLSVVLADSARNKLKEKLYRKAGSRDYLQAGAMQKIFSNVIDEDARKYAGDVTAQTLLLYGENDKQAPPSYGEIFNNLIPNSSLEIIPEAGHYAHHDQEALVEKKVVDFIQ